MLGFVQKIINTTTILVKLMNNELIDVKTDEFTIEEFKDLIESEEVIIVTIDEDTKKIIKTDEI